MIAISRLEGRTGTTTTTSSLGGAQGAGGIGRNLKEGHFFSNHVPVIKKKIKDTFVKNNNFQ